MSKILVLFKFPQIYLYWLAICWFTVLATPIHAQFDSRTKEMAPKRGMNYHDVVRAYGAPLEKKELESKRGDIWTYHQVKIVFQDGKVVAWMSRDGETRATTDSLLEGEVNASASPAVPVIEEERSADRAELENLLGEIVSDLEQRETPKK